MSKNRQHAAEFLDKALADGVNMREEEMHFSYNGVLYPTVVCNPDTFKALESFEARKDDVILVGYPKTGTNWLDHILSTLESTAAKYTEEELKQQVAIGKELAMAQRLEFGDPEIYERMKKFPYRRILITHLHPQALPTSIFKKKAKVLVLIRNPKDTAVSYFHFSNGMTCLPTSTWDQFFTKFMTGKVGWGSYFDHVAEWDKYINDENIMAISYEELKEDLNLGLKKIAKFFDFFLTEEEIQNVAEKSSFKAMKEKSSETHGSAGDIFFRRGTIGDWRSLFSEAQNQEMDRRFEERLAGTKLGAKIKYDIYCKVRGDKQPS
ncbi:sulfotransferase 6B1-like [Tiliqua scincoides]|uniref:sulfotransferase 6B1-like n=1 Tax=Tiliqua scincoides TaxID=71010 RepID=UPI0034631FD3